MNRLNFHYAKRFFFFLKSDDTRLFSRTHIEDAEGKDFKTKMEICHIHRAEECVCGIPQSYPSLSYIQRDQVRPGTCPSSHSEKHCHSEVCCVTHRMVWHLLVISLSVSLCLCSVVCYNYSCLGMIQHKQCPCIVIPRFNKKSIGSLEFLGLKK